ncbi:MAG: toprim domain-containing protein, partial [Elusimicrobiota bacterium]
KKQQKRSETIKKAHNIFSKATQKHKNKIKEYVKKKRKITDKEFDKLTLGYFPKDKWPEIKKKIIKEVPKASSLKINDKKLINTYLNFKNRIIHPHFLGNDVVYLTGEVTPKTEYNKGSKYVKLNSDFAVYGNAEGYLLNSLYEDSDNLIIAEGYWDALKLKLLDYPVVTFGTPKVSRYFVEKYNHNLKKFDKIIICFDTELNKAGLEGAKQLAKKLLKKGIDTYISELPEKEIEAQEFEILKNAIKMPEDTEDYKIEGKLTTHTKLDIDEFINEFKSEEEKKKAVKNNIIEKAVLFWDYLISELEGKSANEQHKLTKEIVKLMENFNPIRKKALKDNLKQKLNLNNDGFNEIKWEAKKEEKEEKKREERDKYPVNIKKKAREILEDGDPLKYLINLVSKNHIGDNPIIAKLLCCGVSAGFGKRDKIIHSKEVGTYSKGKSHVQECVGDCFSKVDYVTSQSAKSKYYKAKAGQMQDKGVMIMEEAKGSEHARVIERKLTDDSSRNPAHEIVNDDLEFERLEINEINSVWKNTADVDIDSQLNSRYLISNVNETKEQDFKVFELTKEEAMFDGKKEQKKGKFKLAQCITDKIMEKPVNVIIPYAKEITSTNIDNRRSAKKFFRLLRAVSYFYRFQRPKLNEKTIVATLEDFEIAKLIWDLAIQGLEVINLDEKHKKIYDLLPKNEEYAKGRKKLAKNLGIGMGTLYERLKKLGDSGLVNYKEIDKQSHKKGYWAVGGLRAVSYRLNRDKYTIESLYPLKSKSAVGVRGALLEDIYQKTLTSIYKGIPSSSYTSDTDSANPKTDLIKVLTGHRGKIRVLTAPDSGDSAKGKKITIKIIKQPENTILTPDGTIHKKKDLVKGEVLNVNLATAKALESEGIAKIKKEAKKPKKTQKKVKKSN